MEIVTHPMSLEYQKDFCWENVMKKALYFGYRSHHTSTCGLHIHVNRNSFYGYENSPKAIMDKAKKNYVRYVAINLCNYHTIEFCLFRDTLKYNTLIATLELVNKICELAVLMDDDEISKISWSEFVAGISYVRDGRVTIFKRPKPAHKIHFNAPDGTTTVMGHTRLTTQGNQKFNQNNHPFYGHADKNFAFAHNGVLYNDQKLRKAKNLPDTHIETDSYIAVQLIGQNGKLKFESLKSMAETVHGSFNFTVLDEENSLFK